MFSFGQLQWLWIFVQNSVFEQRSLPHVVNPLILSLHSFISVRDLLRHDMYSNLGKHLDSWVHIAKVSSKFSARPNTTIVMESFSDCLIRLSHIEGRPVLARTTPTSHNINNVCPLAVPWLNNKIRFTISANNWEYATVLSVRTRSAASVALVLSFCWTHFIYSVNRESTNTHTHTVAVAVVVVCSVIQKSNPIMNTGTHIHPASAHTHLTETHTSHHVPLEHTQSTITHNEIIHTYGNHLITENILR